LGLFLASIWNPFYSEIASGIIDVASDAGYQVFVTYVGDDESTLESKVGALLDHQSAGLIFTSALNRDASLLKTLLRTGPPFVLVSRRVNGIVADFVGADEEGGGREVAQHLLAMGYRDIAVVYGTKDSSAIRARLRGIEHALHEAKINVPAEWSIDSQLSRDGGYAAVRSLLALRRRPRAIICANDVMALGAIDAVWDAGLKIPGDIAVTGYDDMSFASARPISLTTIRQPRVEIGSAAVTLLLQRIAEPNLPARTVLLPHNLVVRATSQPSSQSIPRPKSNH
jgi:LacI family transcriptional regulator